MEEVQIRDEKVDKPLARYELKVLRKYVGQLNWLPNLFICFEGNQCFVVIILSCGHVPEAWPEGSWPDGGG